MSKAKKAFTGSIILIIGKFSERLLGLVSTLILARLLVPEEFGIIAISMLVINFMTVVCDTGAAPYIIQKENVNSKTLNTAWTLDTTIKLTIVMITYFLAPIIADYYDDSRLINTIRVLSLMLIFNALSNPWLIMFKREQQYLPIFKVDIIRKAISIIVTASTAYIYRNHWALVAGHLTSTFLYMIGSYIVSPYRPAPSMAQIKEQWQFSRWTLSKGFLGYIRASIDIFLVSKYFTVSQTGAFHVLKYISSMPGSQIFEPATEPLLASFSRNKNNLEDLQHQYKLSLVAVFLTAIPVTAFLILHSYPIVDVFLGKNWVEYHNIFGIMCALTLSFAAGAIGTKIIVAKGKVRWLFWYDLVSLFLMASILIAVRNSELNQFTLSRIAVDWVINISLLVISSAALAKIPFSYLLGLALQSTLITITPLVASYWCVNFLADKNSFIALTASATLFTVIWIICFCLLYRFALRHTKEGAHLGFIINNMLLKVIHTMKSRLGKDGNIPH